MARSQPAEAIRQVINDVGKAFGDRLVCLALYGSAACDAFIPERSDVNFAVVLQGITLDDLNMMHGLLPAWHRLGVATPLLIDIDFLERARDVFPIELEDMRSCHRILAGDDVLSILQIDPSDLRRQLEQEGQGKLLRLRAQYAETGGERGAIEALMLDSVKSFLVIVRGVLRLLPGAVPTAPAELLDRFETAMHVRLGAVREVAGIRAGASWGADPQEIFRDYLSDIERLVSVIDGLRFRSASELGSG